jgi:hypothetical protein
MHMCLAVHKDDVPSRDVTESALGLWLRLQV